MKKTIGLIIFCTIALSNFAFAAGTKTPEGGPCIVASDCAAGLSCFQLGKELNSFGAAKKICRNFLDALTQRPSTRPDAIEVKKLPSITLESGLAVAIKTVLRTAFLLTIAAIVVAAIYYIISRGKEEDMTKAKDIILYLIIGMAIIAAAYGIVSGITQFNVFG